MKQILPFLIILFTVTGCSTRLPNIKATEIHQTTSFPGFTSTVDASGISVTDTTIKAADAQWRVSSMGVSVVTVVKEYQQKREKEKEDKP